MALRCSEQDVKDVLAPGGDYLTGKPIVPFITAGNSLVDWIQNNAASYGKTALDTVSAKTVETWLAAWAYKMSDQQLASKSQKSGSGGYKGTSGMGLETNTYGQTALVLDTTGMLRALNKGAVVGTAWLGKIFTDMLPYADRR